MAFKNPTRLTFTMPTARVDESVIAEGTALNANLYVDGVNIVSIPGDLNPGGTYTFLFADLGWQGTPGVVHGISVTALEGALESAPSEPVEVQFVGKPLPPAGLSVS
jgi:hypothetical protein